MAYKKYIEPEKYHSFSSGKEKLLDKEYSKEGEWKLDFGEEYNFNRGVDDWEKTKNMPRKMKKRVRYEIQTELAWSLKDFVVTTAKEYGVDIVGGIKLEIK